MDWSPFIKSLSPKSSLAMPVGLARFEGVWGRMVCCLVSMWSIFLLVDGVSEVWCWFLMSFGVWGGGFELLIGLGVWGGGFGLFGGLCFGLVGGFGLGRVRKVLMSKFEFLGLEGLVDGLGVVLNVVFGLVLFGFILVGLLFSGDSFGITGGLIGGLFVDFVSLVLFSGVGF